MQQAAQHRKAPLDALRTSTAFAGIDPADFERAVALLDGRVCAYEAGENIRHTGQAVEGIFVVLEGSVRVGMLALDHELNVETFGPGEVFGEAIAFAPSCHQAPVEITAAKASQVLYLPARSLRSCTEPLGMRVYANLMSGMSQKMVQLAAKIRILGKQRARDKVAAYLVSQPDFPQGTVHLGLTRTAWADYLSTDRSSLNRALNALQEEGVVEVSGCDVRIADPERLAAYASS